MDLELLVNWDDVVESEIPEVYSMYLNELSKIPLLSQEEMKELFTAYHNGDLSAKEKIISSNLKLVLYFAKRFKKNLQHLSYLDLVQEGNIGLIHSVEEYKVGDITFSTYAAVGIIRAISRAIDSQDSEIKKPIYLSALLRQYHFIIGECQKTQKDIPSDEELCERLKINSKMLKNVKEGYNIYTVSLNQLVEFSESEMELEEFFSTPDENYEVFSDFFDDKRLLVVLKEELSLFEFYIVYYRFFTQEALTRAELAKKLCISRERVRQIEQRSLDRIKNYLSNDDFSLTPTYRNVVKKYGKKIDEIEIFPVEPDDIVKYLYIKDKLTPLERQLFYRKIVLREKSNNREFAVQLGVTYQDFVQLLKSLKEKVQINFSNIDDLLEYRNNIMKDQKSNIFFLIDEEQKEFDYEKIARKFEKMNFSYFLSGAREDFEELSNSDKALLNRYFFSCKKPSLSFEELEKEIKTFLSRANNNNTSFSLRDASSVLIKKIINKYYYEMDYDVINSLLYYFDIRERDLLTDMELNHVYNILSHLNYNFGNEKVRSKEKISLKK